ncbi:SRPBCC domain-containing protein [Enterococcus alcedinis]|uniref:Activator of Hsp90 ATPase homologue 1/2-like C-terminal domain-containing protein n=1 Tax=Enterococcus alcedinis TaxID=1274384 RepID=A0A917JEF6_9ENTE|nr:SRPBCC domain-containing protein [Enterococcus alcedinis]MBP2101790.1 uncharacterized protein YndB with AHSA1/START domain [Enterococcus alcedinis]GGI65353.1 hypothetical protein GCM10011482_10070 [Enterococcus alcedinis]
MTKIAVTVTHDFQLIPETIYQAWTQPEILKKWLFHDGELIQCDNHLEINGYFIFTDHRNGQDVQHIGHYLTLEKPNRLQFTWGVVDDLPASSLVTIDIQATPSGSQVTLIHQIDKQWETYVPQIKQSWAKMLQQIEDFIV